MIIIRLSFLLILAGGCLSNGEEMRAPGHSVFTFESDGRQVQMLEYALSGKDVRPAVLMLHGGSGFARYRGLYEKHARMLVENGYRVYAVMYYNDEDFRVMTGSDRGARRKAYQERLGPWVRTISAALDAVCSNQSTDTDKIAVLGFSQGAYLAVGLAGTDDRVAAMVEKYGGLPSVLADHIVRLPPSLIIHGEADDVVPVNEALTLAKFMEELGTKFEIVTYADAGHGFDGKEGSSDAEDSIRRTVDFIGNVFRNSPD